MTNEEKLWAIITTLDNRRTGLLDPQSMVDVLLMILSGDDPYDDLAPSLGLPQTRSGSGRHEG